MQVHVGVFIVEKFNLSCVQGECLRGIDIVFRKGKVYLYIAVGAGGAFVNMPHGNGIVYGPFYILYLVKQHVVGSQPDKGIGFCFVYGHRRNFIIGIQGDVISKYNFMVHLAADKP